MQIGELARRLGISVEAIRFYEARGLVRSDRRQNGYRDFPESAVTVLALVRQAQGLGFTLAEIAEVLNGLNGDLPAEAVRALLEDRIARVERQMAELARLRDLLQTRLEAVCALGLDRDRPGGRAAAGGRPRRAAQG